MRSPVTCALSAAVLIVLVAVVPAVPASAAQQPPVCLSTSADAPPGASAPVLRTLQAGGVPAQQAADAADLQLTGGVQDGSVLAWERVFTPVDRMSSLLDSIRLDELKAVWTGAGKSSNFATIYVSKDSAALLTSLLGRPGPRLRIVPETGVEAAVWGDETGLGIVPFDSLSIRLRAIKVDGQSPVDNRFRVAKWPLTARASLVGLTDRGRAALASVQAKLPATNRDPAKLTVLVMTGVTAMTRGSAVAIEKSRDDGFLARVVGPELAAADITTTSNEIPFSPGCVANNSPKIMSFCSKPAYWENLALSGVDAIGLTGNHVNDYGWKALLGTLAFYKQKNLPVYGGGADQKAAAEPLVLQHRSNQLAFIGANQFGPSGAWAGPDRPGSAKFDPAKMQADIRALKTQGDLVFAELQHLETDYKGDYVNVPNDRQEFDFRGLSDAGADVVTGVMAHAPQAVELRKGKLILYGLGNLYFDQTWSWPTRTGLVARHTIYNGRLINTELLVTVIGKNYQVRWATPAERKQVLQSVFAVSRW